MPVFGIRIDTKRSANKALLSTDITLCTQILEIIYALALLEQRRWRSDYELMEEVDREEVGAPSVLPDLATPLTIKVVRYSNPFDMVAFVKGVSKQMIDAVLDRTLYFKQEVQRRELENAQKAKSFAFIDQDVAIKKQEIKLKRQDVAMRRQEIALKKQEVALKKQEVVQKKIENLSKALALLGDVQRQDERAVDERVVRALAEIVADQDASLGSGNVQVYFPPPKPKIRKRKRPQLGSE